MTPNIQAMAGDLMTFLLALTIPCSTGSRLFADAMATFQRQRFEALAPALMAIAAGRIPPIGKYLWEATKGASKDSDLACVILWLLAFSPRALACQVGAADKDQAAELLKAARDIIKLNPWLSATIEIKSWTISNPRTSSACEILAADIAGSHGARPDFLVINELSHVNKQEFAENLMDNAAKMPGGLIVLATNAGFVGSWQHKWRQIATSSPRWSCHIFSQPSPWLNPADVEEAQQRNTVSRFNRLWYGVWSSGGDALDDDDIRAAVDETLVPMTGDEPDWIFSAGLDLGIRRDHSGLVVVATHKKTRRLRLAAAQSWKPPRGGSVSLEAVKAGVIEAHRRFKLVSVGFDPYQCALLAEQCQAVRVSMVEMVFNGANLNEMASTLLEVFRSRRIDLYPCPDLVRDLGRLTIEEKSYGYRLSSTRDADGHADLATALAIALPAATVAKPRPAFRIHVLGGTPDSDPHATRLSGDTGHAISTIRRLTGNN